MFWSIYIRNTSLLRRIIKISSPENDIKDKTSTDSPLKGSKRTVQRFSTKRYTNGLFRAIKPLKCYTNINIKDGKHVYKMTRWFTYVPGLSTLMSGCWAYKWELRVYMCTCKHVIMCTQNDDTWTIDTIKVYEEYTM